MRVVETVGARIEAAIKRPGRGLQVGIEPGLVGYWKFDELDGQVIFDTSTFGHDGVLGEDVRA